MKICKENFVLPDDQYLLQSSTFHSLIGYWLMKIGEKIHAILYLLKL